MERNTETFYLMAYSFADAIERTATYCKSAAVVQLVVKRVSSDRYEVAITKVLSSSGARSLDRIERWKTERVVLVRKANELSRRLQKIGNRADVLAERLRNAGVEPE